MPARPSSRSRTSATIMLTACLTLALGGWAVADSYGATVPGPSVTTDATAHGHDCETINDITEETVGDYFTGSATPIPLTKPGEGLVYDDVIYNAQNQVIGHTVGMVTGLYVDPANGHLITQYNEVVELPGGTISTTGTNDRTAIFEGGTAHFTAIGTSGSFLGMTGIREWHLTQIPPVATTRAAVTIVLCRP